MSEVPIIWTYENCAECIMPELFFLNQTIEYLQEVNIWRLICPFLTVADRLIDCEREKSDTNMNVFRNLKDPPTSLESKANGKELTDRGFYKSLFTETALPDLICERLAMGIRRLLAHGYSANMILMFDEAWVVGDLLSTLVTGASGNAPIGDWFVFHVENTSSYSPGPPHRDRPTADKTSFRPTEATLPVVVIDTPLPVVITTVASIQTESEIVTEISVVTVGTSVVAIEETLILGAPKYCSVWLALTDATPENSCLYFIPKDDDAGYGLSGDSITDMGHMWQNIVAQPLLQGGFLTFSHRLLHWGSRPQPNSGRGRIALTLAFADPTFEEAYFDHILYGPLPPLMLRLGLVAGQQIQYEHHAPLEKHTLGLYRRIFHQSKLYFLPTYYEKISSAAQFLVFIMKQKRS